MYHQMVISKIVSELIRFGIRNKRQLLRAEYSVYRKAGWKPFAARGISHGTAAGNILGTLINQGDLETDSGSLPKKYGRNAAYKQNKTRSRQQRNSRRCSCAKRRSNKYY